MPPRQMIRVLGPVAGLAIAASTALAGPPEPPALEMTTAQATELVEIQIDRMPKPDMTIGDKVPKLELAGWVQGQRSEPVEKGAVTVVECWATWCGPCIRMIPHVAELYEEYQDKNVNFVAVSVWEREEGDELADKIAAFVRNHKEMIYPVAWDHEGSVADNWLKATNTMGIPAAFIVDEKQRLAWTGHPMRMDEPLKQIAAGEWNLDEAREKYEADQAVSELYGQVMEGIHEEATADEAYRLADALVMTRWSDQAGLLNAVAWNSVTDPTVAKKSTGFAIRAAHRACDATNWQEGGIIDTLARAWWEHGDRDAAIELQELAVKVASTAQEREGLTKTLNEYKKAKVDG